MKSLSDIFFARGRHVCPWWCCFTFDNPIRKLFHNPMAILAPYVNPGQTLIDIGPGMGFFTIPMCIMTGRGGKVIAIDIQEKMLLALSKRAQKCGVQENLRTHLAGPQRLGIHEQGDFILAFWMVHEVPDQRRFLEEVKGLMAPDANFLLVEPRLHVSARMFEKTVQTAIAAGFTIRERPAIPLSQAVLFTVA